MCLVFLKMLWVKKCHSVCVCVCGGGGNIFPVLKIWNYFFLDHLFKQHFGNFTDDVHRMKQINLSLKKPQIFYLFHTFEKKKKNPVDLQFFLLFPASGLPPPPLHIAMHYNIRSSARNVR